MNVWTSTLHDFSNEELCDHIDALGTSAFHTFTCPSPQPWARYVRVGHTVDTVIVTLCEVWISGDSKCYNKSPPDNTIKSLKILL